jgi:hypothetical protein
MASTNKTTNLELSQYVSSDKPTYLVDYNSDMSKIDTGVHTAQVTADTASTAATNAQTTAEGAQTTANTAITNAATAQSGVVQNATNIGTLANLTTVEKTSLVGAINEVDAKNPVVDSMSGTETNKAPSVNAVKLFLYGTTLYSDATGSSGDVTLNDSIANYPFIEIFYTSSGYESSKKIDTRFVTTFNLNLPFIYNNEYFDRMSKYSIANNKITFLANLTCNSDFTQVSVGNPEIAIKEVIGYKY